MSIISFRAPIAIAAAGIAAAGAAIVALSPVAHADDQWGACAAPASTGQRAICSSNPYPDQATAESRALSECNYPSKEYRRCTVVVSFMECGAIAQNGSQWVGGRGLTQDDADRDALNQLANGVIEKSACVVPG
jgi:hypothetical protein